MFEKWLLIKNIYNIFKKTFAALLKETTKKYERIIKVTPNE